MFDLKYIYFYISSDHAPLIITFDTNMVITSHQSIYIYRGYTPVYAAVGESAVLPSAVGGGDYKSLRSELPGGAGVRL